MSSFNTALKLLKKLLEKGQLDRETDSDLFLEFRNPEVRQALAEMEEELDFQIIEASSTLYLVPAGGNSLLGFTSKDLREWVSSDARLADAYLLTYIAMFIFFLFYGGKNQNPKQREFLRLSKLLEELDQRFAALTLGGEQALALEEKYSLNFIGIAGLWESKQGYEEKSRKTKAGTVLNVWRLLEREGLIRILDNEREIRPTRKLDDLMLNYYLNDNRVAEIIGLFQGGEEYAAP